jgi:hypothetical protein
MVGAATCMLSALSEGKAGLNSSTRRREAQVRSSERLTRCRPPFPQSSACTLSLSPLPSPFLGTVPIWACSSRGKHWNDWLCMLLRLASLSGEENTAVARCRPDPHDALAALPSVSPTCRSTVRLDGVHSTSSIACIDSGGCQGSWQRRTGGWGGPSMGDASTRTDHVARSGATTTLDVWKVARRGQKLLRVRCG